MSKFAPLLHQYNQQPSNERTYSLQSAQDRQQNSNQRKQTPSERFQEKQNPEYLRESQIIHINNQINLIQRDITDNNKQIRLLNGKISKSDYEHSHLNKLYLKDRALQQKQRQLQQAVANYEFMTQQFRKNKLKDNQVKHELGIEYQYLVQEKKRRLQEEKRRQLQQQSAMINYTQKALSYQHQRKKQYMQEQRKQVQQELRLRQQKRNQQKAQREREKTEFNNRVKVRNQLQTQKDQVYKQYYNHFMDEQEKLQSIYKNKAGQVQIDKERQRLDLERRDMEGFQQRLAYENNEKLRKLTNQKQALKNYLKAQMEENNRRKSRQKQQQLRYQNQVRQYQVNQSDYEYNEKMRRKQQQRRYQQQLGTQVKFKTTSQQMSQSLLRQSYQRQNHNPITNPIDFKIGITNPYVIKEYQNTKQKYLGDNHLKLRNLAAIGNNSLVSH